MKTETGKLIVGRMPYLNSEVFYRALPRETCELVALPPRAMAAAVERGEMAAGPLPLAEVFRLGDLVRPIDDLCIASRDAALSVLLFSKVAAEQLGGAPIAVTSHTATSIQLLRVLFADLWRTEPGPYVELDEPHVAKLIIGDEALRLRGMEIAYPYVYDLGVEWWRLTGLPFVYALWVIRSDVDARDAARFEAALQWSLARGIDSVDAIAEERRTPWMNTAEVATYVRNFIYRLSDTERYGMEQFRIRLSRLPVWRPTAPEQVSIGG